MCGENTNFEIEEYDYIDNPWTLRKGVMVVDIEAEEGRFYDDPLSSKFRCGVIYSYDDDKYYTFEDPEELTKMLNKAKAIVSFNGEYFDFPILSLRGMKTNEDGSRRVTPSKALSYDIMDTIFSLRSNRKKRNKFPSLDELIYTHYGVHKKKYDIKNPEKVLDHCLEDVRYTKMLYEESKWKVPIKKVKRTRPKVHVCFKDIECRMMIPYLPDNIRIPCPTCDSIVMDLNDFDSYLLPLLSKDYMCDTRPRVTCSKCNTLIFRLVIINWGPYIKIITYGKQDCRINPEECDFNNPDNPCKRTSKCFSGRTKWKYVDLPPAYQLSMNFEP